LEINRQFLEYISRHKKTLVFDVDESCIHPHKVVGFEDVVGKSFSHEKQLGEEDRVV